MTALFRAPLWQLLGDKRHVLYPVTQALAAGTFLPAGRDDRWIYAVAREPGALDRAEFDRATMTTLIRIASGVATLEPKIERLGDFAYTALLADRYRAGNAFLVGDAAHLVTPRGGTGMNMAIRDGYDLGWKLGWVLRGWAEAALLDSYEAERRPVAEHNVVRSVDQSGSLRDVADELHVDLGGRIPHVWVDADGARRSTLDLLGEGLTLFTASAEDATRIENAAAPVTVRTLPPLVARTLGVDADGSLLVRPDGVPLRGASKETCSARARRARVRTARLRSASSSRRGSTAPGYRAGSVAAVGRPE
jgi:2-polyprenyl-6-methoxyphenol hydroxylase-like FAD-dependent oxidoreductase